METKHVQFDFRRCVGAEYGSYLKFLPNAMLTSAVLIASVSGTGSDASVTLRLDAETLDLLAQDCMDAASLLRKIADDKLNNRIEAINTATA